MLQISLISMDFSVETKKTDKEIDINEIFDGYCPFCYSKQVNKRSSRVREIQELGSPLEKVVVYLTVRTYECQSCTRQFSPEHPFYPPNYDVSKSVLKYALTRYNYKNASGNEITHDLSLLHNVDVSEQAVYKWLKELSPDFIKERMNRDITDKPDHIISISVDGSYVDVAKDTIGKKKNVESLSVTKLENGQYLLIWWE